MFKKFFMGLLAVAIALAIAGAGYQLGKHLANNDNATSSEASST